MLPLTGRVAILLILLSLIGTGFTQDIQAVDSLFFRGVNTYRNQQYRDADQIFELINRIYPNHHRESAVLLMQGKCSYKLNAYRRALNQFTTVCEQYSESPYVDDAKYGMGNAYYRLNQYTNAVKKYLEIVEESRDTRLQKKAAKLASDIMDYRMSQKLLEDLSKAIKGEKAQAAVSLRLAKIEMDNQHYQTAKRRLQQFFR